MKVRHFNFSYLEGTNDLIYVYVCWTSDHDCLRKWLKMTPFLIITYYVCYVRLSNYLQTSLCLSSNGWIYLTPRSKRCFKVISSHNVNILKGRELNDDLYLCHALVTGHWHFKMTSGRIKLSETIFRHECWSKWVQLGNDCVMESYLSYSWSPLN